MINFSARDPPQAVNIYQPISQGLYECQVNTEPKINWPVTVHVEGKILKSYSSTLWLPFYHVMMK